MLSLEQFAVSKFYHPKELSYQDGSQDPRDMRRMHLEDQKEQYAKFVARHEPESSNGSATGEEERVAQRLAELTTTKIVQPVVQQKKGCATKKDAQWWKEYRKRPKFCPHCKKQI